MLMMMMMTITTMTTMMTATTMTVVQSKVLNLLYYFIVSYEYNMYVLFELFFVLGLLCIKFIE